MVVKVKENTKKSVKAKPKPKGKERNDEGENNTNKMKKMVKECGYVQKFTGKGVEAKSGVVIEGFEPRDKEEKQLIKNIARKSSVRNIGTAAGSFNDWGVTKLFNYSGEEDEVYEILGKFKKDDRQPIDWLCEMETRERVLCLVDFVAELKNR